MNLCQELCSRVWNLPTIQDRQEPDETSIYAFRGGKINLTLCKLFNGLDNGLTTGGRVRLYPRRGRQREHKGGNSHPNNENLDARRGRTTSFGQPLQIIWLTGQNAFRQRTSIRHYGL